MSKHRAPAYAKMLQAICSCYGTSAAQAAQAAGVHEATARRFCAALHKSKVIYVCGWGKDSLGRDQTPLYAFGSGDDVPRTSVPAAERMRAYRARLRKTKEK